MTAPDIIRTLVDRFGTNIDQLHSSSYNETQIRREYLDPLFMALGWDIDNHQGFALPYREVIHEDSLVVAGGTKAPDYSFRIGGMRKFFLEAKKPSVNLKDDASPAFQLRRYAWSAKLPLSILSDFEEFAVYDCRTRPSKVDKASNSRISYFTFPDFVDKWEEIHSVFSKDAVLHGSFDKYAEAKKGKKGTADVDDAFLAEIETWRSLLARNIALRNPRLSQPEINFAVQRTVDRIIFLRICEDRGIETYGRLQEIATSERTYKRLVDLFRHADDKYNSGLFHFSQEKDRSESLDTFTLDLKIDDKVMKDIIGGLYYPESPYEFSVLPADILGSVYERFLGKVIRLTAGHQAKIEEKPEVRKAGGVYYTPTYIVDYIVKNTVGTLVGAKTPKEISSLRVLDPACGSGSFLIGAYQYLLDWHRDWYMAHEPAKLATTKNPPMYLALGGEWKLTTTERKRILLNNIYGVDIDTQAVEVTKLSLLLKVLEGENEQTINAQLKMFHERALPDLGNNIKCGNSLIGPDFFEGQLIVDAEERMRINAFDWKAEFKEIMDRGGFDAVIGNPPYVFGRDWKGLRIGDDQKEYFAANYKASPYQLDMFSIFMEKAHTLTRGNGRTGQIVPNIWLTNSYSSVTRSFVLGEAQDLNLVVPPKNVFAGITVDTVVYYLTKARSYGKTFRIVHFDGEGENSARDLPTKDFVDGVTPISTTLEGKARILLEKLVRECPKLGEYANITRGVHPYRTGGYGQSAFQRGSQTEQDVQERPYHSGSKQSGYRPFIYGKDLKRLVYPRANEYVKYGPWLAEPRDPQFFEGERVYSRKILGERLIVTVETADSVADQQVYITKPIGNRVSAKLLAGVLGSRLIAFFIKVYYDEGGQDFPQIKVSQLKSVPMPLFGPAKRSKVIGDVVALIGQTLEQNQRLTALRTDAERTALERQIDTTDKQIDALVYELYGLNEEEIRIVESLPD